MAKLVELKFPPGEEMSATYSVCEIVVALLLDRIAGLPPVRLVLILTGAIVCVWVLRLAVPLLRGDLLAFDGLDFVLLCFCIWEYSK